MSKDENIQNLEKAITDLLLRKEIDEFRWIRDEERSGDDGFETCLMIDGDAHDYFYELGGVEEINLVSADYGCFADPINYIDIGFYSIADW